MDQKGENPGQAKKKNPSDDMDVFLRRVDNSSREVLPSVVCLSVIVKPR
jgi:hypothetical protein